MTWKHDHAECIKHTPVSPKTYTVASRRYTFHEFKSGRYIDAIHGNELAAEARAIDITRRNGGRVDIYYKAA